MASSDWSRWLSHCRWSDTAVTLHQAHCLGNLSLFWKSNVDTTARNRNSCPYKERYKIVSTTLRLSCGDGTLPLVRRCHAWSTPDRVSAPQTLSRLRVWSWKSNADTAGLTAWGSELSERDFALRRLSRVSSYSHFWSNLCWRAPDSSKFLL